MVETRKYSKKFLRFYNGGIFQVQVSRGSFSDLQDLIQYWWIFIEIYTQHDYLELSLFAFLSTLQLLDRCDGILF